MHAAPIEVARFSHETSQLEPMSGWHDALAMKAGGMVFDRLFGDRCEQVPETFVHAPPS
jgi:hypothetical protein